MSFSSADEGHEVVPFEVLLARAVCGPAWEPELHALDGGVLLAVVELALQAAAGPDLVLRRDGDVAPVEHGVDVRAQEQAIRHQAEDSCHSGQTQRDGDFVVKFAQSPPPTTCGE